MSDPKPATLRSSEVSPRIGTVYPAAFAHVVQGRSKQVLGDKFGLDQFGVNLTTLAPGAASALRHYHQHEDEFVYVLEGELTLVDNSGEHPMTPGMCAGFKAGVANGHQLVNKSSKPAVYIEIGTRSPDEVASYPDVDLKGVKVSGRFTFTRKDGSGS